MGKLDDLTSKFATDLKEKCGIDADMELLGKVARGLGPALYREDAALVASSDSEELERVRKNFLIGKLGLPDGPALAEAIDKVTDLYGRSNRTKYRAVFYYLLVQHFNRAAAYA